MSQAPERMETSWHSYPKVWALGHRAITDLLLDPVIVEEKIDGSQFSFGLFDGELRVRSKGCVMNADCPEKMFQKAVAIVQALPLTPGWTYRAEYLQKPKHNALAYSRIPINHLAIFDINTGPEEYLPYEDKAREAERLDLEAVPVVYRGMVGGSDQIIEWLNRTSILGGQSIEGVVIKNYARFGEDKKVLMGKYVSEAYKEVHSVEWKKSNPTSGDIVDLIIRAHRTPSRWAKAVQHLRDAGALEGSPRDIGNLLKAVHRDIADECALEIKEALFKWAGPKIMRGVVAGMPEWYKQQLMESQFGVDPVGTGVRTNKQEIA